MTYTLRLHPSLQIDIDQASEWYDTHENGLGREFAEEVNAAIEKLLENPFIHSFRDKRKNIRVCKPVKFPYEIMYQVVGNVVVIGAVVHSARHDRAWKGRF